MGYFASGSPRTIQLWLTCLVVICLIPAVSVAGFLIIASYQRERATTEQALVEMARALVQVVDEELKSAVSGLQVLASSSQLATGDLGGFYEQAHQALGYYSGNNIVLSDSTGQQLMNTLKPLGEPLPRHGNPEHLRKVFETGKPMISDLFSGGLTGQPLIAVEVPVFSHDKTVSVLSMGFFPDRLVDFLQRHNSPADRVISIFDKAGVIIARTHGSEGLVGQKGSLPLTRRLAEISEGTVETVTEGIPVLTGFSRSALSGWSVVVGAPRSALAMTAWQTLWIDLGFAAIVLLLAGFFARIVSTWISRSIRALSVPAFALGSGEPVSLPPTVIREVDEVGRALVRARELIHEGTSENQRLNIVVNERERAERKFRQLVESAPDSMLIADAVGQIHLVNAQTEQLFGYPREELVGQGIDILIPRRFRTAHAVKLTKFVFEGRTRRMRPGLDTLALRKDETEIPVEVSLAPLQTEDGPLVAIAVRDVTERRRQADQLRAAREKAEEAQLQAERANRAKSNFLASMSHELRTPLHAIAGFAQLLAHSEKDNRGDDQVRYAANILAASKQLQHLVDDVLSMARIEVGRIDVECQSLDGLEVLTEVSRTLEVAARQADIMLTIDTSVNLPCIFADRGRLVQVLLNLGSNAIKYNVRGGWVVLTALPVDGAVRFIVKDTGPGIPAERHDQVFEPFNRLGAEMGSEEGTGLGLALSRRLVLAMKGQIGFESTVGRGSEFWVDIPVAEQPGGSAVKQPAMLRVIADEALHRVLYVEDKITNIELMRTIIESWQNAQFIAVQTVAEAVHTARALRPHVIITDIHLPDGMGFDLLEQLRADPQTAGIPIIALTADAMRINLDNMRRAGFDSIVTKPFEITEFIEILRRSLKAA